MRTKIVSQLSSELFKTKVKAFKCNLFRLVGIQFEVHNCDIRHKGSAQV